MMNAQKIYEILLKRYGKLSWWPAETPYEVIVGAVLTQNTAWGNVEKAIGNFNGMLSPQAVLDMDTDALIDIIRPAGFFNQKSRYLKAVTAWFAEYDFDIARRKPLEKMRAELLAVKGVGRETADSILLYAFGLPTFVVDAYTARLCERMPLGIKTDYETIKAYFEAGLPKNEEIFNNYHALIVINGKEHCKKKPVCNGCPLYDVCGRCGV